MSMANEKKLDVLTIRFSLDFLDPLVDKIWNNSVIKFIRKDPTYSQLVNSGIIEDTIRQYYDIDDRLRRFLSKLSLENWRNMQTNLKDEQKKQEFLNNELEYDRLVDVFGKDYLDYLDKYNQNFLEDQENWEEFLNNF